MWKVCYPTVYLWSQVGSSLSGHLLVAILELSAKVGSLVMSHCSVGPNVPLGPST